MRCSRPLALSTAVTVSLCATIAGGTNAFSQPLSDPLLVGATAPLSGEIPMGKTVSGHLDPRTGGMSFTMPVMSVPGIDGETTTIGVNVDQLVTGERADRFQLGAGWRWSGLSYVDLGNVQRFHSRSGEVFDIDASSPSGLARHEQNDVVFRPQNATLPGHHGNGEVSYGYRADYVGGLKEFFATDGNLVATIDTHGNRIDTVWGDNHRLLGVTDSWGSHARVLWDDAGVSIVSPERSDGVVSRTDIHLSDGRVDTVTSPRGTTTIAYTGEGYVDTVESAEGALTSLSYHDLPDETKATASVVVRDTKSGNVVAERSWEPIGERIASGYPDYTSAAHLWYSTDAEYRYRTVLRNNGTSVVREYNARGWLVSQQVVVDSSSGSVVVREERWDYSDRDNTLTFMGEGNPVRHSTVFRDASGHSREQTTSQQWDDKGRVVWQRSPDGTVTEREFDEVIPEGSVVPVGNLVRETVTGPDNTTKRTENTIDEAHRDVIQTTVMGGTSPDDLEEISTTALEIASDGFVTKKAVTTESQTVVTRYERTVDFPRGLERVTTVEAEGTSAEATTVSISDVVSGLEVETIDAVGRRTLTSYDNAERPTQVIDPAGRTTKHAYGDRFTEVTDPAGIVRRTDVDVLGRTTSETDNVNDGVALAGFSRVIQQHTYSAVGSRITTIDERGAHSTQVLDVFGRIAEGETADGIRTITVHDDVAQTISVSKLAPGVAAERTISRTMNDAGHVTLERDDRSDEQESTVTQTLYDGLGRRVQTQVNNVTTRETLDAAGRPLSTTITPEGDERPAAIATREYAPGGAVAQKTLANSDGASRVGVQQTFDAAGRVVSETDQAGATTMTSYTADGLIATTTNATTGVSQRFTYDPATRVLLLCETERTNGQRSAVAYEYDLMTDRVTSVWDVSDRDGSRIQYSYDAHGNVVSTTYPDGKTISHEYEGGREVSMVDVFGNVTRYERGRTGRIDTASQTAPDGNSIASVSYRYDSFGRVTEMTYGNGLAITRTYTATDRVKTEKAQSREGVIRDASYEYDSNGLLLSNRETRRDTSESELVTETTTYGYDALGRLIDSRVYSGSDQSGDVITTAHYDVNISGDITKESTTIGDTTSIREFTYNDRGHLETVTTNGRVASQNYDNAGNLTRGFNEIGTEYGVDNQPTLVSSERETTRYDYWATGQRRQTVTSEDGMEPRTTTMYWDNDELVNEAHSASVEGNLTETAVGYLRDETGRHARVLSQRDIARAGVDTLSAQRSSNTPEVEVEYYATDRHGSVTHLLDDRGVLQASYRYTDYGVATARVSGHRGLVRNPYQYSGEYTLSNGMQLLGSRIYDPLTMRFTTRDSVNLHNRYNYADLNPVTRTDPTGHTSQSDSPNHFYTEWQYSTIRNDVLFAFADALYLALDLFLNRSNTGLAVGLAFMAGGAILSSLTLSATRYFAFTGLRSMSHDDRAVDAALHSSAKWLAIVSVFTIMARGTRVQALARAARNAAAAPQNVNAGNIVVFPGGNNAANILQQGLALRRRHVGAALTGAGAIAAIGTIAASLSNRDASDHERDTEVLTRQEFEPDRDTVRDTLTNDM